MKRGIQTNGICKQCEEGLESVEHLFFHCPKTQLIWKLSPVSWEGLSNFIDSLKAWWTEQGKAENGQELVHRQELLAYIMWQI